jgi:uncharacterized phage infection (PIP) family protein YhgE
MRALLAAVIVCLAVAAAGCGGGDESPSAEENWAGEVCTSISSWRTEVEAIARNAADALTEPGATRADLESAIDDGLQATEQLSEELRAAVPPDTPEGNQAEDNVNAFLDEVRTADNEVRSALADLPDDAGLTEVVTELAGLAANLQQTIEKGRGLVDDLTALGGDLKNAFEDADSCQELREAVPVNP